MNSLKDKRILILAPYYFPQCQGGAPHVYRTMQRLSRHEIAVYASYDDNSFEECEQYDTEMTGENFRVKDLIFHVGNRGLIYAAFAALGHIFFQTVQLVKTILKFRPDVLCCGAIRCTGWLAYLAAKITRVKLVSYVHGEELTIAREKGLWSKLTEWGECKVLHSSVKIIVVSSFTRDKIIRDKNVSPNNVAVVQNGVALEAFFPVPRSLRLVDRYRLHGKKVLLTLTRLEKKKGVEKVVLALPRILEKAPDLVYLVGGKGSERQSIDKLAHSLGLENWVRFADFVPDEELNEFMNLADVFVLANHEVNGDTEGFGLVFLQANACGVPVVGGKDGGTADAVADGLTGILVDGADERQIADAVIKLMTDDSLRKKIGDAGYLRAHKFFSWQKKVDEFDSIISSLS